MQKTILIAMLPLMLVVWGYTANMGDALPPSLKTEAESIAAADSAIGETRRNAIVVATQKASPAVVTVLVSMTVQTAWNPFFDDPFFRDWNQSYGGFPGHTVERQVRGSGSGFIFDESGYIMTAEHVVHGAEEIAVVLGDGERLIARLVGADFSRDIAVLQVEKNDLPHLQLGTSSDLMVGEWVIALGSPFWGAVRETSPTITVGVVSAIERSFHRSGKGGFRVYSNLIQTDAAINPGNSGGPLVNSLGQVIGINTAIISPSGGNVGIGFAVGIDEAKDSSRKIILGEGLRQSTLGVYLVELTEEMAESFKMTGVKGLLVADLDSKGPAALAGISKGDILVRLNGRELVRPEDYEKAMQELKPGKMVELIVNRRGTEIKGKITLADCQKGDS